MADASSDSSDDRELCDHCGRAFYLSTLTPIDINRDEMLLICTNCYCPHCGYDPNSEYLTCECEFCEECGERLNESVCPNKCDDSFSL